MKNCYQKIPSFELLSFHFRHFQSAPLPKKKNVWQSTHTTSKTANYPLSWSDLHKTLVCMVQGGYSDLVWTGCAARVLKPYPFLRAILAEKGTYFWDFSQNIGHFSQFLGFCHVKLWTPPQKKKKLERGTHFRDGVFFFFFFLKRWDPCLGISY